MLAELSISNFAIIDRLNISFSTGLTVLTGETGAGKSIIIDAIGLLVGGRASSEWVRHGAKKAEIEGLFYCDHNKRLHAMLEEHGLYTGDETIILKREIAATGKNVCRVNGKLVTLQLLKDVGSFLIDIHGQHEHQSLLGEDTHVHFLDTFGGSEIRPLLNEYEEAYASYSEAKRALTQFSHDEQHAAHRFDLLRFQHNEIQSANLVSGEEEELTEERNKLVHFERTYKAVAESYHAMQNEHGTLDTLRQAMYSLTTLEFRDSELDELERTISSSFYVLEDASFRLSSYFEGLEFDPKRLDEIESRIATIRRLQKKYGASIDDILTYDDTITKEIQALENKDDHTEQLRKKLQIAKVAVENIAEKLTRARQKCGKQLVAALSEQLQSLYMDRTRFEVRIVALSEPSALGKDKVAFYISPNPGEPLKPLVKTASGGEISRVMLALKAVYAVHMNMTSIIFDEVDTGVSGRVAQSMGEKIYTIAHASQVLCITHLPQVAALADQHLYIRKKVDSNSTHTEVIQLCDEERTNEVARMISGQEVTQVSRHHAHELLQQRHDIIAKLIKN
ncbi:MAG: DNA repair protein RecN [Bacilli bacterium]